MEEFKEWHIFFHLNDCSLPTPHEQTHKVAQQLPWCAGEHKDLGSCLGVKAENSAKGKPVHAFLQMEMT